MPSISGPSITCSGRSALRRASSTSPSMKSVMPCTSACDSRSSTGRSRQARSASFFSLPRSEEHTSELQSLRHLVCRLLLEKKKKKILTYSKSNNHLEQQCNEHP